MDDQPDRDATPTGLPEPPGNDPGDISQDPAAPGREAPTRDKLDR
jgi:hypothetical protein